MKSASLIFCTLVKFGFFVPALAVNAGAEGACHRLAASPPPTSYFSFHHLVTFEVVSP